MLAQEWQTCSRSRNGSRRRTCSAAVRPKCVASCSGCCNSSSAACGFLRLCRTSTVLLNMLKPVQLYLPVFGFVACLQLALRQGMQHCHAAADNAHPQCASFTACMQG
jgi:hypothetical protein